MPALAVLAPSEAGTSLLGLCMAAVTPLSSSVSLLTSCQFLSHVSLGWEYSQCSKYGAQSSAANPDGESGVSGLGGVHKEGMRSLPGLQDAVCSPNCPVHAPQILLILTALVVAAAFTGLGIKWAEEWKSARISLQVSHLDSRDSPAVPRAWPVGLRLRMLAEAPSMAVCTGGEFPALDFCCLVRQGAPSTPAVLPGAAATRLMNAGWTRAGSLFSPPGACPSLPGTVDLPAVLAAGADPWHWGICILGTGTGAG